MFVTFEGLDGVGKTTHVDLIYQKFIQKGIKVVKTSEPFIGNQFCKELKEKLINNTLLPLTDIYLIYAMRNEHINSFLLPHLKEGYLVLCDRFIDSSIAYLCADHEYAKSERIVNSLHSTLDSPVIPDLTILLTSGSVEKRIDNRSKKVDRFDKLSKNVKNKISSAFEKLHLKSNGRIVQVDNDRNLSLVSDEIYSIINQKSLLSS